MRGITAFLLLHFIAVTLAPGWIVADFWVEQDRIAQELCVQRMVPDAERTCHGECSLMKRLDKCADREQNLPNEIRAVRIGDMIADESELAIVLPTNGIRFPWGSFSEEPLDGHKCPHAPVPWC